MTARPHPTLIRALRHAHRWAGMLKEGTSLWLIAERERMSESHVARIMPLATLSPGLQDLIVEGTQPLDLSLGTLVRRQIPLDRGAQDRRFGQSA